LHNPPGEGNALTVAPNAPYALKERERENEEEEPRMNQWSCLLTFLIAIPLLAVTAEWVRFILTVFERMSPPYSSCLLCIQLVDSLERVRETSAIKEEWFGLILLPLVSFSGQALVTIMYYVKKFCFMEPQPPSELANGRTIDLSIQFTMFWMPAFILIAWWSDKPFFLLFGKCISSNPNQVNALTQLKMLAPFGLADFFEVAVVIGACFLVNSVTDDAKTNWAEGLVLLSFYIMVVSNLSFSYMTTHQNGLMVH
jgi:Ca2+:H+ antiporter